MKFTIYQESRLGKRANNEDRLAYSYSRDALLMAVADGMGGHIGGEIASASAVDRLAPGGVLVIWSEDAAPELARALAGKLQGDAWQLVQSGLCVSWLNEGRQDAALQLLGKLDPHHRGVALSNLLRHLIEAGEERQALELLAQPRA